MLDPLALDLAFVFLLLGAGSFAVAAVLHEIDRWRSSSRTNALAAENARLTIGLRCVEAACDRRESHDRIRRIAERTLHPFGFEKDTPHG